MNHLSTSKSLRKQPPRSPLASDWTISAVIDWLGEDDDHARTDRYRDALGAIEAGLARTLARPASAPSVHTPFIVRSIVMLVLRNPALGALTIAEATAVASPRSDRAGAQRTTAVTVARCESTS